MDNIYENIEEYSPDNGHTKLIVFDNMIVDMLRGRLEVDN